MRRKIAIIGTVGIPAKYGGFETLTEHISRELNSEFDLTIYCSSHAYSEKRDSYNNCNLEYINLRANGIWSVFYDVVSILHALRYADVLLVLGVSGCILLPFISKNDGKKIIVNIDGLEWKRSKWGSFAKKFLKFSERLAVENADFVVADNVVIRDYVENTYNKMAHLIAYGGNHCSSIELSPSTLKRYPFVNVSYAFKVCRIEPENNIHIILEAFADYSELNLVLVGNWNSSRYGMHLKERFNLVANIYLLDPIYDQTLLDELRSNCFLYIHGHSAGGTNPSLVEAMWLGLPIIAFGVNYNIETTRNRAKYFTTKEDLINELRSLRFTDVSSIGMEMKKIAAMNYKWSVITKKYAKLLSA